MSSLPRSRVGSTRFRSHTAFLGLLAALAAGVVGLVSSATAAVHGTRAEAASSKTIHVAVIEDVSGSFAPISGAQPSLAFIKNLNAHGGLDGYKVVPTVYDGASTPAGTLQAARHAAQGKPAAILMGSWNASSANAYLATTGIPVVGFGALGGYQGYHNVFSDIGEASVHTSNVWLRALTLRGDKKIALLQTTLETAQDNLLQKLAAGAGATVVYNNSSLPYPVDSPTALSLAQDVKNSGANGVYAADGGDLVQADLNQLGGSHVTVLEVSAFGPSVISQWGSKVNGMVFGSAFASAYVKNSSVAQYVAEMKKYGYSKYTYNNPYAIEHYAATKMLFYGMQKAGPPFRASATVAALNKLHNYTAGGLLPYVSYPAWHKIGSSCIATATVTNGQWVSDKNGANPFICSTSGSVGF